MWTKILVWQDCLEVSVFGKTSMCCKVSITTALVSFYLTGTDEFLVWCEMFCACFFFGTIIVSYYSIALCFCHYPSWSKLGVMFSACIQWTAVKEELMQHLQLRQGRRAVWLFLCSWLYYWITLRWLISWHLATIKANILSLFVFFFATKSRRYRIRHVRDEKCTYGAYGSVFIWAHRNIHV